MAYCPRCGTARPPNARSCLKCGERFDQPRAMPRWVTAGLIPGIILAMIIAIAIYAR